MPRPAHSARRRACPAAARGTSSAPARQFRGAPAALGLALSALGALGLLAGGCGRKGQEREASGVSSLPADDSSTRLADLSPDAGSAGEARPAVARVPAAVEAREVKASVALAEAEGCDPQTGDIATYLQDVDLALGGRPSALAASWTLRVGSQTQVGFGGFDDKARKIARPRAVGPGPSGPPRLFPASGESWHLLFFDGEGLAHARPRWEALPAPEIEHLPGLSASDAPDVGLAEAPGGAVAVVAPFGEARNKLGVFLLGAAPERPSRVKVVAVTRSAKKPRRPAVAVTEGGYFVAWTDEGDVLRASYFDATGKESGTQLLGEPSVEREDLTLVPVGKGGALAIWREGERVIARGLDAGGRPSSPPRALGRGSWVGALPAPGGAVVAWVGTEGELAGQLLAARISPEAEPAGTALRLLEPGRSLDARVRPVLAASGGRLAFAWTEPMSVVVSTKRAVLRTVAGSCLPR